MIRGYMPRETATAYRVLMSAGEVSGDAAGARVAAALRQRCPDVRLCGLGGRRMREAGVEIDFDTNRLASVGISEPFTTLPALAAAVRAVRQRLRGAPPDAALLIGNDLFNVVLARVLRRRGVPAISYFPPQVWLWKVFARPIARSFDSLLTCFGEEQEVYSGHGVPAAFVGHYLCDELAPVTAAARAKAQAALGLLDLDGLDDGRGGSVVGLLPGSRQHEIRALLPALLDAAAILSQGDPRLAFVLPVAEPRLAAEIAAAIAARGLSGRVVLAEGSHQAMRASDLLLVASGTASLEATLLRVPMVILCRISRASLGTVRLSQRLGLLATTRVGLPNLLLRRAAVPEILQGAVTGAAVAAAAAELLAQPERRAAQIAALAEAAGQVSGEGAAGRVADWVLQRAAQGAPAAAVRPRAGAAVEAGIR
jgi:lipid-A-disaccharide synthase